MNIETKSEAWKVINGYENFYEVSNLGNVRSCERTVNHGLGNSIRRLKSKCIKPWRDNHGYPTVSLSKEGKVRKHKIHRLVAEAFILNPENKPTVNHINEVRHDNRVENLEWATYQENNNHGLHNERVSKTLSKPVEQLDRDGNVISNFESIKAASLVTGINAANIKSCLHHQNRLFAGGYKWRYKV